MNLVVLIPLIFAFPKGSQAGALGLANVMSSLVNVMLLSYALRRKMPKWKFVPLLKPLVVMIFTAGISGMVAWFIHEEWMNRLGAETIWLKIGEVFVPAILAFGFYWGITSMIGLREARDLLSLCRGHEVKD